MQEISYKDLKFNPFNLIGDEWMRTAGARLQEGVCRRNPAQWHHLSGNNRPELSAGRLSHHVRR